MQQKQIGNLHQDKNEAVTLKLVCKTTTIKKKIPVSLKTFGL